MCIFRTNTDRNNFPSVIPGNICYLLLITFFNRDICNPVTYSEFLTTTVTFDSNPVVIKLKDVVGGEFTITLTLNGDKLNIYTVYTDKDGNPGVNKSDDFKK